MKGLAFVSHQSEIARASGQVVVSGGAFCALASARLAPPIPADFVEQAPRRAGRGVFGNHDALRVWLPKAMLAELRRHKKHPALALDSYVRWGCAQRMDVVLVGGAESAEGVSLDIFAFNKRGALVATQSKRLAPRRHRDFCAEMALALTDIQQHHRGCKIKLAAPLGLVEDPALQFVEHIGEAPFARLPKAQIRNEGDASRAREYAAPLLLCAASVLVYAGGTYCLWSEYAEAREAFLQASQGNESFDDNRLARLQAQKKYIEASQATPIADSLNKISSALSGMGTLTINRIYARQPPAMDAVGGLSSDAELAFEVEIDPAADNEGALAQASPILTGLSQSLGSTLRLVRSEPRNGAHGLRLRLLVEGIAHAP